MFKTVNMRLTLLNVPASNNNEFPAQMPDKLIMNLMTGLYE